MDAVLERVVRRETDVRGLGLDCGVPIASRSGTLAGRPPEIADEVDWE